MENKLKEYREQIDNIDKQLADCFEKRMNIVLEVAEYKQKNNINTFDPEREKRMLETEREYIKDEKLKDYYIKLLEKLLEVSKEYQNDLRNNK